MAHDDPSWEPPLSGTELAHLLGSLERMRATFWWKASGLDATGLAFRFPSSDLSLGRLLKHLARAEDQMFTMKLWGEPVSEPWRSAPWDDEPEWDFTSADDDTPEQLYLLWSETVARSRASTRRAVDAGGLDHPAAWGGPELDVSLRRLLFDLLEEYGRHTGHADLLREAVDGVAGEDPPHDMPWPPAVA